MMHPWMVPSGVKPFQFPTVGFQEVLRLQKRQSLGDPKHCGSSAFGTAAYFMRAWDVGPGVRPSVPAEWISEDGLTIHLEFYGDGYCSVRRGKIA